MGLAEIVFIIFLILKLAAIGAVADWSWVWVTSPLWITYGIALLIWSLVGLGSLFGSRR